MNANFLTLENHQVFGLETEILGHRGYEGLIINLSFFWIRAFAFREQNNLVRLKTSTIPSSWTKK